MKVILNFVKIGQTCQSETQSLVISWAYSFVLEEGLWLKVHARNNVLANTFVQLYGSRLTFKRYRVPNSVTGYRAYGAFVYLLSVYFDLPIRAQSHKPVLMISTTWSPHVSDRQSECRLQSRTTELRNWRVWRKQRFSNYSNFESKAFETEIEKPVSTAGVEAAI